MKKSNFPIMLLVLLILTGCSKEEPVDYVRYRVDKDYYFTITFEGRTLTSYGFEDIETKTKGGPSLLGVTNKVWIFEFKHVTLQNITGVPAHTRGDVEVQAEFHDLNSAFTGIYRNVSEGKLKDLKTGKVYVIDYQDVEFNVDGYNRSNGDGLFAEGSFTFNLKEPNSNLLIPATGTFRSHCGK